MKNRRGFTLIEVVVSLLLLALMSVMAYQAVDVVLNANERSRSDMQAELALQRTWQQIGNDLYHLRARRFDDGLGGIEPAYMTGENERRLSFSRGGGALLASNPTGLSRVQYELNSEQQVLRRSWPVFASPRESEGRRQVLLSGVRALRFEQLDANHDYVPNWPPLNEERSDRRLPTMIRVTIELEEGGTTWRQFPGVEAGPDWRADARGRETGTVNNAGE